MREENTSTSGNQKNKMNPQEELAALHKNLRAVREQHLGSFDKLIPYLEDFVEQLRSRPAERAQFVEQLVKLIKQVDDMSTPKRLLCTDEIIHYTMRKLKWPEIGAALKEHWHHEPDPSKRMWMEQSDQEPLRPRVGGRGIRKGPRRKYLGYARSL